MNMIDNECPICVSLNSICRHVALLALLLVVSGCSLNNIDARPTSAGEARTEKKKGSISIAEQTRGFERLDGLLTCYLDHDGASVWIELPPPKAGSTEVGRFLYTEGLATGLGSNPIGLDRSQIGPTRLVVFRRVGNRLLVEQQNLRFRALSDDPAERKAVREAFATSILWAGEISVAEPDGRTLVDFTKFVVRDAHRATHTLKSKGQGDFSLDLDRSVLDTEACLAFPDNVEFEAILTFASKDPGDHVIATVPTAQSVTLVQHHSLIRLPDDGYRPRRFDPRAPSFGVSFLDYAAPLTEPIEKRWIERHRLEKIDSAAPRSKVKEPIVYYVDPGAPEPVRSALIEGASWWRDAFEASGFMDAFRVEILPDGVHPLDVRYNVIQWVHRSTRGWSYARSITDPRTGEIIKGQVSLGSQRVRQDRLLFEGLAGTDRIGTGDPNDPIQIALARIRQLAAHEVGHTLGFAHNFASSTYGDRASVMDYPAPQIGIATDGTLDFSNAYAVGIGTWDKFAVKYAYSQFPENVDAATELTKMIQTATGEGLLFLSDDAADEAGAAHPLANRWDNGADPVAALEHTLSVRRIGLDGFGRRNIREGTPLALLHEVFVPVYLHHRYQLEAAVKVIGGSDYSYAVRGDGRYETKPVNADWQRRALDVVLRCVAPDELDIREEVLSVLFPRPFGYDENRELFAGKTQPVFDALGAAATAADLAVQGLLNPQRCARLVDQKRRDESMPGLTEVLNRLIGAVFEVEVSTPRLAEINRSTQDVVVARMIALSARASTAASVRSHTDHALAGLHETLTSRSQEENDDAPHAAYLSREIARYLNRSMQSAPQLPDPLPAPPGSPIGLMNADESPQAPANMGLIPHDLGQCSVVGHQLFPTRTINSR